MDKETIEAYERDAEETGELHASLIPEEIYRLIDKFFIPGGNTVDVGCGIGRDSDWLARKGFQVCGLDASRKMLSQAEKRYPYLKLILSSLPGLPGLVDNHFDNVLCSAVLMHLRRVALPLAVENLARILKKNGVVVISFRGTKQKDQRENGKLYEVMEVDEIIEIFCMRGFGLLHYGSSLEKNRGHLWHSMVFKKSRHLEESVAIYE